MAEWTEIFMERRIEAIRAQVDLKLEELDNNPIPRDGYEINGVQILRKALLRNVEAILKLVTGEASRAELIYYKEGFSEPKTVILDTGALYSINREQRIVEGQMPLPEKLGE